MTSSNISAARVSLIAVLLITNSSAPLLAAVKTTPVVSKTNLAAVDASLVDSTIDVEATVKSITTPREGSKSPFRIGLADETGTITLVAWPDVFAVVTTQTSLATGDLVHVSGRVSKYREEIQLTLPAATDLRVLAKAETPKPAPATTPPPVADNSPTPLASVNNSLQGKNITIQATISAVQEPRSERAPFVVTLTDGSAKIPMVFWSDLHAQVKKHILVGNVIRVKVSVGDYRGTLQLRLRSAQDIQTVSPTPPATTERKESGAPPRPATTPGS